MATGIRNLNALLSYLKGELAASEITDQFTTPKVGPRIAEEIAAVSLTLELLSKYGVEVGHPRKNRADAGSITDLAIRTLSAAGRPLKIDQIIRIVRNSKDAGNKEIKARSLSSRMAKLAKQGRVFVREGKNTYRLADGVRPVDKSIRITRSEVLAEILRQHPEELDERGDADEMHRSVPPAEKEL